jgi:hypothetical protein
MKEHARRDRIQARSPDLPYFRVLTFKLKILYKTGEQKIQQMKSQFPKSQK